MISLELSLDLSNMILVFLVILGVFAASFFYAPAGAQRQTFPGLSFLPGPSFGKNVNLFLDGLLS
jgi:hypothetical protein